MAPHPAEFTDAAVLPKLLQSARNGSKPMRVAALELLDRFGDLSAVPVLLNAASEADADVARTAKATLTRMEGKPVDAALLKQLGGLLGVLQGEPTAFLQSGAVLNDAAIQEKIAERAAAKAQGAASRTAT